MTEVLPPTTYPFERPDRLSLDAGLRDCRSRPGLVRVQLPHGRPAWLATRYEDVKLVLGDNRFSRALAVAAGDDEPRMFPRVNLPTAIAAMDPPDHTRLRRVIIPAFTARKVSALAGKVKTNADTLLDKMADVGPPADLVEDYAVPLTITMLCDLLGIPSADQTDFRGWVTTLLSNAATRLPVEQVMEARTRMVDYLSGLITQRRQEEAHDLLSAMVHARDEQDRLTEPELLMLGITVLAAGYDSLASQLVNIFYLLLTEPDLQRQLRASPEEIPQAIEEFLRFIPLGWAGGTLARVARQDVEVGGFLVRAGETVVADLQSANRDEAQYPDPDTVDFSRTESSSHLAFGHGVHHCVGAQLARTEIRVAAETILSRFSELRIAVPVDELVWKTGLLRGCENLPVEWSE
ncbi:cytochrome P450 [Saccharopolyspora sp. ASAGF58]|uniref:cytochrome P450 n=1 Tax=Saccharopolyspora sp. ASAGF58 TaxID=2719023 RepID=UPI00143FFD7E|nr:cytochrome P450 [Saccharopolyspora sp. ASAGF58]QIZ36456.1 cytochrome P450 [Saccharopolyspora sp. ASAGF58]